MRKWIALVVLFLLSLNGFAGDHRPSRQAIEFASSFVTVPVMVNKAGLFGSFWKTRVSLLNPTALSYPIRVTLYDTSGKVSESTVDVTAGQVRNFDNFLQDVFSFTGAGAVRFDSLNVTGGSEANNFIVNAEVYTDSANGRYRTPVTPSLIEPTSSFEAYSAGINVDPNSRTNLGCFNNSASSNTVNADLFDSSNTLVTTVTVPLGPNAWNQVALPNNVTGGYIKWRISQPAQCYAVVVDNTSNDGNFIQAAEYNP
jgi:hypothetical protein